VLASCGADPAGPGGDACGPPPQTHALSRAFAEHACLHAVHGPFEAVEPPPDGGPPVELRNAHVAYTVPLGPNAPGAAGPGVFYEPKVNAPFAFFLGERRPLSLVDEGGRRVCPVAVHDATACAELARAVFFDLQRKRPYRLEVGPGEAPAVVVVIEEVF
jgi:hypothetical protein